MNGNIIKTSIAYFRGNDTHPNVTMLDFNDLYYFASVVKHGGFSAASRALNLPKSTLSRRLSQLEAEVGFRLIERSTRRMGLTDIGKEFYSHCLAMIAEAEAAQEVAARLHGKPRGIVRASCPPGLTQSILAKRLPQFLSEFPDVRVQLHVSNRRMDLIEHRLDVAIRARSRLNTDGNLIVRQLAESRFKLVASPAFVTTYGKPVSIKELEQLPTLSMEEHSHEHVWQLIGPDMKEAAILHEPRLASSDFTTLLEAAISGIGIGLLPDLICNDAIHNGKLVHVLPDWHTHVSIVHLLFASRRGLLPAVRVFIDFLVQVFAEEPHELIGQHASLV